MKVKDKTIIVTGGANGIGRELVLALLRKGSRVAAVDINEEALKETMSLAGDLAVNLSVHRVNITDRAQVEALPASVIAKHGTADALINNAGIIQPFVRVNDLGFEAAEKVMNVNFYGTLNMVKVFLPYFLNRPEAHIVNLSSMGGFLPVPGQTIYGASKAAAKLLTEGLYAELAGTNVKVTLVVPGAIATNITGNSGVDISMGADSDKKTQGIKPMPAPEAARLIIEGMEKDKYRMCVGKDAKFLVRLYRLSPGYATNLIVRKMSHLLKQ
ncbi:MAG: SDR family NAD(P)-dependent oxidoreductase [Bacteroidales bacterium]|nr:SDR family NAD(P)-dependent oxidoreductase [Bacteroidales bacterium]